jgi:hypothetical protein
MSSKKPNKESILTAIVLLLTILAILTGCTAGNYGRLESNKDVTRKFEDYQILPNHKYYYRGTYNSPIAIAGIDTNYQLNLSLWVPIDPKSKNFRTLIDKVSIIASGSTARAWGFNILDQAGNVVGVWYSPSRGATVKVDENNQIVMLSPMPTVARGTQRD